MLLQGGDENQDRAAETNMFLFLGLFLLLLAFFVVLVHNAKYLESRKNAVFGSVAAAFESRGLPALRPDIMTSNIENAVADSAFIERIGALVRTHIPIAEVTVVKPGRDTEIRVPAATLFRQGNVSPRGRLLLARVAEALARPPAGLRYELEIRVGTAGILADTMQGMRRGPIRIASSLAQLVEELGAPASVVSAGMDSGGAGWIRLLFHVRGATERSLLLDIPEHGQ